MPPTTILLNTNANSFFVGWVANNDDFSLNRGGAPEIEVL